MVKYFIFLETLYSSGIEEGIGPGTLFTDMLAFIPQIYVLIINFHKNLLNNVSSKIYLPVGHLIHFLEFQIGIRIRVHFWILIYSHKENN
jgi:hypothetical protein